MKKNRKNKGFTLVELIVVLVILAILAAMLVPALTGYIDKANEKVVAAESRSTLMACQTLVSDLYGRTSLTSYDEGTIKSADTADNVIPLTDVEKLSEIPFKDGEETAGSFLECTYNDAGLVTDLVYKNSTYTATYDHDATGAKWTYSKGV